VAGLHDAEQPRRAEWMIYGGVVMAIGCARLPYSFRVMD
jgi:hypothetical protein